MMKEPKTVQMDIVEELRRRTNHDVGHGYLYIKAADEIEKLRADNKWLRYIVAESIAGDDWKIAADEIERLRAQLAVQSSRQR